MNLVIDLANMVHRARSGFQRGENSISFMFSRMFRATVEKFNPDRIYVVLEGRPEERKAAFSEYKATRSSPGDDFWRQQADILGILQKLPVWIFRHPREECDDVIGHIVTEVRKDEECIIVSSDSDFTQLLKTGDDRVRLWNPVKEIWVQPVPYDYVSWKSLTGDSTDGVPGFKGIGGKTAEKIVTTPGKLEEFLSDSNNREIYNRNYGLISFHKIYEGLEIRNPAFDAVALQEDFERLGFKSILVEKSWKKYVDTFDKIWRNEWK